MCLIVKEAYVIYIFNMRKIISKKLPELITVTLFHLFAPYYYMHFINCSICFKLLYLRFIASYTFSQH